MHLNALSLPIRWVDIDAYQHVGHQRYFDWMSEARAAWYGSLQQKLGLAMLYQFVVVDVSCNYQRSLFYPGTVYVTQELLALGQRSISLGYHFYQGNESGALVATASAKVVCIDSQTLQSTLLPSALREFLIA